MAPRRVDNGDFPFYQGYTVVLPPLLQAASDGDVARVRELIQGQQENSLADFLERRDRFGWTALSLASEKGHRDIVLVLLEAGANPSSAAYDGKTPLMIASFRGQAAIVSALVERGAQVDDVDEYGQTALWWACKYGHAQVVEFLLGQGQADGSIADSSGRLPLAIAIARGHHDAALPLLHRSRQHALHKARCLCTVTHRITALGQPDALGLPYYVRARAEEGRDMPRLVLCSGLGGEEEERGRLMGEGGARKRGQEGEEEEEGSAVVSFVLEDLSDELYRELRDGLMAC